MAEMSMADVLALQGRNDNTMGGSSWLWWVLLIFLLGGNGGFNMNHCYGFGGYGYGLSNDFLFSNLNASIDGTRQSVINTQNGLADLGYALNNGISNLRYDNAMGQGAIKSEMAQGFAGLGGQIAGLKSDMQAGFCCVNNTMHMETQRVIDLINQNTTQALRDQLADEKLAKSQLLQNAYLVEKLAPAAP